MAPRTAVEGWRLKSSIICGKGFLEKSRCGLGPSFDVWGGHVQRIGPGDRIGPELQRIGPELQRIGARRQDRLE